jgi:hypothetical protein
MPNSNIKPSSAKSKTRKSHSASQRASSSSSKVRRNIKGGVHVNPAELKQAFQFFDVEGNGYITVQDLKKRLGVFYQSFSIKEYKFLMNNKTELTEQGKWLLTVKPTNLGVHVVCQCIW